ncbi:MAG TPA: NADH-quinone oxidoreductase subunit N [Alphaproteobacteria bacterium]|nr:NADH-quinone oxidoreductase subunit N [Alphaproteobacteria bacterium]
MNGVDTLGLIGFLPAMLVAIFAVVVLMVDLFSPQSQRANVGLIGLIGLGVALWATVRLWGAQEELFGGMFVIDFTALFFQGIFLTVGFLTVLLSVQYTVDEGLEQGEYYALLLFAVFGAMLMGAGGDLLIIFLGLEILSVAQYILAGMRRGVAKSSESAMKYFLLGAFATGFLLYGIALLYGATGTTNLAGIVTAVREGGLTENPLLTIGMGLLVVGFGFKIAAVPFHMWTPDVYEGAPTPVTAFMSTGVKAAAFAALARVFLTALGELQGNWTPVFWVMAIVTMTVGNIVAIAQQNIKRMLAYSSIAHAGYLLIAMTTAGPAGFASLLYYLAAYTFMTVGAFAVVVALEQREDQHLLIGDYGGLGFRYPLLGVAMALCMFSLSGLPPTAGFMAKFYVFSAAVEQGYLGLAVIGVLNSLISVYYYLRPLVLMYMEEAKTEVPTLHLNPFLVAGLVLTILGTLHLGLFPSRLLGLALMAAQGLLAP